MRPGQQNVGSHALLHALPEEILVLDRSGAILECNEAWSRGARARGWVSDLATDRGANYLALYDAEGGPSRERAGDVVAGVRAVLDGRLEQFRLEFPWDDARERRWFLLTATPLATAQGGAVVAHADVTERHGTEQALRLAKQAAEAADHARSTFLGSMSHELRTPLNAVIGFSQLLEERSAGPLNDKQLKYVQNILVSGRQLLGLIDNVLDLTRVEAARMSLQVTLCDLGTILHDVRTLVQRSVEKKRLTLTAAIEDDVPLVTVDQPKIKQVFFALLSSAITFTPEGGRVTVFVRRASPEWVEVSIADTGVGATREELAPDTEETLGPTPLGGGMGLALVRRQIELHGGSLVLESKVGSGTTAVFRLPTTPLPPESTPGDGDGADQAQTGPLVLVIEDDAQAAELLTHYLGEGGYSVARAATGEQAISMVQSLRPAAITLDPRLPDRDGLDLLALFRTLPGVQDIPVVVISVTRSRDVAFQLGALAWLVKPVRREELLEVLGRALQLTGGKRVG